MAARRRVPPRPEIGVAGKVPLEDRDRFLVPPYLRVGPAFETQVIVSVARIEAHRLLGEANDFCWLPRIAHYRAQHIKPDCRIRIEGNGPFRPRAELAEVERRRAMTG